MQEIRLTLALAPEVTDLVASAFAALIRPEFDIEARIKGLEGRIGNLQRQINELSEDE